MTAALYEDAGLLLDENGITIRRYYFPIGSAETDRLRRHPGRQVAADELDFRQGPLLGDIRPALLVPAGLQRGNKQTLLILDVGARVKPCITPENPDRVLELLSARVPVS